MVDRSPFHRLGSERGDWQKPEEGGLSSRQLYCEGHPRQRWSGGDLSSVWYLCGPYPSPALESHTNAQIQIHKCKFTNTNTQMQIHKYGYKYKYKMIRGRYILELIFMCSLPQSPTHSAAPPITTHLFSKMGRQRPNSKHPNPLRFSHTSLLLLLRFCRNAPKMTFSYPINWNLGYLGPFFHLVNVLSQTVTGWFMCSLRLLLAGAHCDSVLLIPPSIGIWRSTKVGSHPPSCPPLSIQHLASVV